MYGSQIEAKLVPSMEKQRAFHLGKKKMIFVLDSTNKKKGIIALQNKTYPSV